MTKKTRKKATTKTVKSFSLDDIASELGKFEFRVLSKDSKEKIDEIPYRIPFKHKGLQKISGGVIGGKFCEISGNSGSSKSFLAYELAATCQAMGGYVLFFDGERALEEAYLGMMDINDSDGTFAISYERDMDKCFALKVKFINGIRKKKRNAPILIITDSYPSYQCKVDLANMEQGKDPRGYMHMQKNGKFSAHIEKFVPFLAETDSTFVLLNQTRTKIDQYTKMKVTNTLCEEIVQFWATQRLQGTLAGRLFKEAPSKENKKGIVRIDTGVKAIWSTIKNRAVKPFQKVLVKIRFSKGIDPLSGLEELLINENKIKQAKTTKDENGTKLEKPIDVLKVGDEVFYSFNDLLDKHPEMLEPYWTGTYDDGEDLDEVEAEVASEQKDEE